MADDCEGEVICPKVELLTAIETNILCSVEGCSKILPNTSSLRMHLVKTHNVVTDAKENTIFDRGFCQSKTKQKTLYCCPVNGCVRGRNSGRPFNRLAHVKQHYMTVHGEKKFCCKVCAKTFGRNDARLRHEKACGTVFSCSCGCPFNSWTSMLTHAKRNGHTVPDIENKNKVMSNAVGTGDKNVSDNLKAPPLCISVLPVISKSVSDFRPLRPKKLLVNAETQTEQPCYCANVSRPLVQSDKGITVDIQLQRAELGVSCGYTQTMDEAYTQTSFITEDQNFDIDDFTMDNEEFKELTHSQTQTSWELHVPFDGFPLFEDNQTQTLESYLEFDPSSITSDCATQTKNIFDDIFSVDTQTQTLLPIINFTEEQFDGIHCNPRISVSCGTQEDIYADSESS